MRTVALRRSGLALAVAVVLVVLACSVPDNRVVLLNTFLAYGALVLSLDLMVGNLNLLPAGHAAFFGAGAYASVVLNETAGWPLPLAGLAAVLGCGVVAALIGFPVVGRTAGMSFAVVTFAIGELMVRVVAKSPDLLGGTEGLTVMWGVGDEMPFGFSIYRYFSLWLVVVFLVVLLVVIWIRSSHWGLRLTAIRDDENASRGLGLDPVVYKTVIFGVASALAAAVGVAWAPMVGYIGPDSMATSESIFLLSLLIVGGVRSVGGALAGVFLLMILPLYLEVEPSLRIAFVGGALALIALVEPGGIAGLTRRGRSLLARRRSPA
ncbi:branched-chain amino acid ABC transporter permease [Nocardioides sp. L-11A]|uniref:branched-chain amino acid ABC transporter permease n=1 Tax=Nocardioides sp. L-11A TaxID=3043848 RepID=UPI002499E1B3|nr:branched-chain amino acid ABC transporter permease [Nocardioides sp. L-11A]